MLRPVIHVTMDSATDGAHLWMVLVLLYSSAVVLIRGWGSSQRCVHPRLVLTVYCLPSPGDGAHLPMVLVSRGSPSRGSFAVFGPTRGGAIQRLVLSCCSFLGPCDGAHPWGGLVLLGLHAWAHPWSAAHPVMALFRGWRSRVAPGVWFLLLAHCLSL